MSKYLLLFSVIILFAQCNLFGDPNDPDDPDKDVGKELVSSDFSEDLTLEDRNNGVDYIVNSSIDIYNKLIIRPDVVIEFAEGAGFDVRPSGSLEAKGLEDKPIVFTGDLKVKGSWKGIIIESNSLRNVFEYCTVEYAGSESWGNDVQGGLTTWADGGLNVDHCSFKNNKVAGAYFYDSERVNIRSFDNSSFANNDLSIFVNPSCAHNLGANNTYADDNNFIRMHNSNVFEYGVDGEAKTWKKMTIPYLITGEVSIYGTGNVLTLEPGVEIQFESLGQLYIRDKNALLSKGTSKNPILMRGVKSNPGSWKGLYYAFTKNNNNILEYTEIRDAGNAADDSKAGIYMWGNTYLDVKNCTFSNFLDCIFEDAPSETFDNPNFTEKDNEIIGGNEMFCN